MFNTRVIYSKLGPVRFISHLDLMRVIFRGINRAQIPVAMSQGFSPHQQVSFGPPLSVGMEGECEFLDIELTDFCDLKKMRNSLQYSFDNLLEIKDIHHLNKAKDLFISEIDLFAYDVYLGADSNITQGAIDAFISQNEIIIERTSGEKKKKLDIKPLIKQIIAKNIDGQNVLSIELFSENGLFVNPYDLIKTLFNVDDGTARTFMVRRTNMFSTTKSKKVM